MRSNERQFDMHFGAKQWPILTGPFVVSAYEKNVMNFNQEIMAGHASAHSRDGPIIFHMRDGPPRVTGPPGAVRQTCGPPRFTSESGPPKTTGPPMAWLARKKSLKKTE